MVKLYVEGGGTADALRTDCRRGFNTFITKAGITKRPRIVACGSRQDAYDSYLTAIENGESAVLIVDAETQIDPTHQAGAPDNWKPWEHLEKRIGDKWTKPTASSDTDCHLMAQLMESWFIADRNTLAKFYGSEFKASKLPSAQRAVESIAKSDIYAALKKSTKLCKTKGEYGKGSHSFKILAELDPSVVQAASPWAKRFVDELKKKMLST